jgi:hypothetical protein
MNRGATGLQPVDVYNFHGVTLGFQGDLPAVRLLCGRFKPFLRRVEHQPPDLTFEFLDGDRAAADLSLRPPGPVRPIYDLAGGEVLYSDSRDELYVVYDDGVRVRCDVGRGHVWFSVLQPRESNQWLASHIFFTIPFVELLKRRARYSLHAAGLCVDGEALLLAGPSGSGKTTLTVALMQAGFSFLGDDMLFLAPDRQGLRILAFPDELDIAPDTGGLFPALRHLAGSTPTDGGPKHRVRAEDLPGSAIVWECRPGVLVFPRVAHTTESVLRRIDAHEALVELAANVLLTQPHACQAHLDTLGRLARESSCYRLETGRDLDRLPGLLRGLFPQRGGDGTPARCR